MEEPVQTTLQHPNAKPFTRPYASFLDPKVQAPEQVSSATQISSDSEDNEHQPKMRARLTRENLALFNKMARMKGTNEPSASNATESSNESLTTKTTSTNMSGFAIQAYKNGILNSTNSKPPTNLKDIHGRYAQSRKTASPTQSVYEHYVNKTGKAHNEATMVFEVGTKLLKDYDDKGYLRTFNQAFTGFPKDVGFNHSLSVPQPDFVEGLEMQEYGLFPVDEYVRGAVLYKDDPHSLTLPHLAGEWKGRGKDMEAARLQSAYTGAALVFARNQALSLIGKPDPPGHAEVTTFTTDGTNLNIFTHYAAPSDDGSLAYHQYLVESTNLRHSCQGFQNGRRGLRNEQDHAREQSYVLRDQLKEHWKQRRVALQAIAKGARLPVPGVEPPGTTNIYGDEDEDEDEAGYEIAQQPCEPTPPTSSEPERPSKHGKTSSS